MPVESDDVKVIITRGTVAQKRVVRPNKERKPITVPLREAVKLVACHKAEFAEPNKVQEMLDRASGNALRKSTGRK